LIRHGTCGDLENLERTMFLLLALISSLHEAIASTASVAKDDSWLQVFEDKRKSDPLLRYLWMARNADIHDAIVKWTPELQELELKIVDPRKAHVVSRGYRASGTAAEDSLRLFEFLFHASSPAAILRALDSGYRPKPERLAQAGVELEFMLQGFVLKDFDVRIQGKTTTIPAPSTHLGSPLLPGAHVATEASVEYYRSCLSELRGRLTHYAA
jgi:hypothetical protein